VSAVDLFGRHVGGRADCGAGHGESRILIGAQRDAEVAQHRASRIGIDEDVLGLHIAMYDTVRMRVGKRRRDIVQESFGLVGGQWPTRFNGGLERPPRHELHHEGQPAIRDAVHGVHRHDVRML
jgi:hypothetical protein